MTIQESINAALAQSSRYQKVEKFSKAFRSEELGNIEDGESFVIPEDYVILSQKMMRGGQPVLDSNGNPVTAEFIKCLANTGRVINFFPTSMTKVAFRVDEKTGKDVTANRIVRTEGDVAQYAKNHPDMNATMEALKGCTIQYNLKERVPVRAFGVSNEDATEKDVQYNPIGKWNLIGDKKPANWTV